MEFSSQLTSQTSPSMYVTLLWAIHSHKTIHW